MSPNHPANAVMSSTLANDRPWQPILDFWFLADGQAGSGQERPEWFRKDPAFDASIRQRFLEDIETALTGGFAAWDRGLSHGAPSDPRASLARIILLDQFTRNVFRDTPLAFSGDARALSEARSLVDRGADRQLNRVERSFVYLPFEHAEDLAMQERGVALFEELGRESGEEGAAEWAIRHRDIIARFGRFPHRNQVLGRTSTPDEIAFLKTPGSSF